MGDVPKPPVPDIVIQILGGDWPEGSETAMRALADIWDEAAKNFGDAQTDGEQALRDLLAQIESESETAMEKAVNEILIEQHGLPAQIATAEAAAKLCRDYAGDLEITKWAINLAMVEAAASIGFLIFGPGGIAAATIKLAAKRLAMRELIRQAAARIAMRGVAAAGKMTAKSPITRGLAKNIGMEVLSQTAMNTGIELAAQGIAHARNDTGFHADRVGQTALGASAFGVGSGLARHHMGRGFRSALASGAAGGATSSMATGGGLNAQDMAYSAIESAAGGNGSNSQTNANASAQSGSHSVTDGGARSPSQDGPSMAPLPEPSADGPNGPGPAGETVTPNLSANDSATPPGPSAPSDSAPAVNEGPLAEGGSQDPPAGGETVTPGATGDSSSGLNLPDPTTGETAPATGQSDSGTPAHGAGDAVDGNGHSAQDSGLPAQDAELSAKDEVPSGSGDALTHDDSAATGENDSSNTAAADQAGTDSAESPADQTPTESRNADASDAASPAHHAPHTDPGSSTSTDDGRASSAAEDTVSDGKHHGEAQVHSDGADTRGSSHDGTSPNENARTSDTTDSARGSENSKGTTTPEDTGTNGVSDYSPSQQTGEGHSSSNDNAASGVAGGANSSSDGHSASGTGEATVSATGSDGNGINGQGLDEGATSSSHGQSSNDDAPPGGPAQSPQAVADSRGYLLDGEGAAPSTGIETTPTSKGEGVVATPMGAAPASGAASAAAVTPSGGASTAGGPAAANTAPGTSSTPASAAPVAKPAPVPGAVSSSSPHPNATTPTAPAGSNTSAQSPSANPQGHQSTSPSPTTKAPIAQPAVAKTAAPAAESTPRARLEDHHTASATTVAATPTAAPQTGDHGPQGRTTESGAGKDTRSARGTDSSGTPLQTDSIALASADSRCAQSVLEYLGDKHPHRSFADLGDRDTVPAGELHRATGSRAEVFPTDPADPFDSTHRAYAAIERRLIAIGPGSSAVISVDKTDAVSGPGHALLGENVDGTVMVRDPSTGQYHSWPPQYEENGPVAVSYLDNDGAPVDPVNPDDSSYAEASDTIGEIDGSKNKPPVSYTERVVETDLDRLPQSMVEAHRNLPPGGETTYYRRTGTMPKTGMHFEEFRAETVYPPGEGLTPGHPQLRDGEQVTVTSVSLSEP